MEKSVKFKAAFCVALTLLTIYLLVPTFWSLSHPDADKLPEGMPKTAMRLGLDLQGGVHMVLGVDVDKVVNDQLASYGRNLEVTLAKEGVPGVTTKSEPAKFELEILAPDASNKDKIAALLQQKFPALHLVGDSGNTLVVNLERNQEEVLRSRAIEQTITTIRNRIDEFGVSEPLISRKGDNQILVQFPGAKEPERLKALIGQTAKLEFRMVHECTDGNCLGKQHADLAAKIKAAEEKGKYSHETLPKLSEYTARVNADLKGQIPADTAVYFQRDKDLNRITAINLTPYLLSTKDALSGEYIENAYVGMTRGDRGFGADRPVVDFQMNPAGAPLFGELTGSHVRSFMAIVLDGVVKSAPQLNSQIRESGQITLGNGSVDDIQREANDLSIVLRAGALPAQIEIQEERVIGPSMGLDAIEAGRKALGLASILVLIFMWSYYGVAGLIAGCVTLLNVGLIIAILGLMGATLTLPGIAGIVLTLGMAVDALIIIYERMREEIRAGRTHVSQVVDVGFDKAFATILDSNVTTAMGAVVLYQYGTGSIRGFALTLLVGIIANVFMATFFTKSLFEVFIALGWMKQITVGLHHTELKEARA